MSRTTITHPDGSRTTIVKQGACGGCLTVLLVLVVLFGPAAWWPGPGEVVAYTALGLLVIGGVAVAVNRARAHGQPPPVAPIVQQVQGGTADTAPMVTPDHKWVTYDGGDHFVPYTSPQAPPIHRASATSNLADELQRLADLHRSGALSDEEFTEAKHKALNA